MKYAVANKWMERMIYSMLGLSLAVGMIVGMFLMAGALK